MVTERLSNRMKSRGSRVPTAESRLDESRLVEALRRQESRVCLEFFSQNHGVMVRLALPYVGSVELAEEAAQETWAAFLQGLRQFEGRSSVRTWLFSILLRKARGIGVREGRSTPISQLGGEIGEARLDPLDCLFHDRDHPDCGSWAVPVHRWDFSPEDEALARERQKSIERAKQSLPENQRLVFTLHDAEGWSTPEIAELLDRSSNWVRVVLHRARLKIRQTLEAQLGGVEL